MTISWDRFVHYFLDIHFRYWTFTGRLFFWTGFCCIGKREGLKNLMVLNLKRCIFCVVQCLCFTCNILSELIMQFGCIVYGVASPNLLLPSYKWILRSLPYVNNATLSLAASPMKWCMKSSVVRKVLIRNSLSTTVLICALVYLVYSATLRQRGKIGVMPYLGSQILSPRSTKNRRR